MAFHFNAGLLVAKLVSMEPTAAATIWIPYVYPVGSNGVGRASIKPVSIESNRFDSNRTESKGIEPITLESSRTRMIQMKSN